MAADSDWRDGRVGTAQRGENPPVLARLHTGWGGVIGDTQHLPGYSLLLYQDPRIDADDRSARAEDQPVNEIAVNAVSELFI